MKKSIVLIIAIILVTGFSAETSAMKYNYNNPHNSYIYNSWNEPVDAPAAYEVKDVHYFKDMGLEDDFKNPGDLFVSSEGNIFVSDTENGRVVILDSSYKLIRVLNEFKYEGEILSLKNPRGVFVSDSDELYVADTENSRVLKSDLFGNVEKIFLKPDSELFPQSIEYRPLKVLADTADNLYVLAEGVFQGIVLYNPDGLFEGFYGSNRVNVNAKVLLDYFWKRIMTNEQIAQMSRYVPINYLNMHIDSRDFVYAVSTGNENRSGRLVKLNPSGVNILRTENFGNSIYGDKEILYYSGRQFDSQLISVSVDFEDYIYTLDSTRNRIYMYDQDSNLISVFGGEGSYRGKFRRAVAIDTFGEDILVLDQFKNSITVFTPTDYGHTIRKAFTLYNQGLFDEAVIPWEKALKVNGNLDLAYSGIGKALYKAEETEQALDAFRDGYNRTWYSTAFQDYRKNLVRDNFLIFFIGIIILILIFTGILKRKKLFEIVGIDYPEPQKVVAAWKYPFKIFKQPLEAFEDLKYHKAYSYKASFVIIALWVISRILNRQMTGFAFNYNKTDEFNLLLILGSTVFLFVIWSIVNWSICTLLNGEGKLKEIWVASSYALLPYVAVSILTTIASNFITIEEGLFLTWSVWIAIAWSILLLIGAVKAVHQYEMFKAISSILLTILGIAIVLFILVMFFSLIQQVIVFVTTVGNEIFLMFR